MESNQIAESPVRINAEGVAILFIEQHVERRWGSPPGVAIPEALRLRERTGADRLDEMWEGVLHTAPSPIGVEAGTTVLATGRRSTSA